MFATPRSGSGHVPWDRSLEATVWLTIAFGVAGLYMQEPPIQPPGIFPWRGLLPKKRPACGRRVIPNKAGRCVCKNCGHRFMAGEADDYRRR